VLRAAGVVAGVGLALLVLVAVGLGSGTPEGSGGPQGIVADAAVVDAGLRGSFLDAALARAQALPYSFTVQAVLNAPFALAAFLLGLVAGRRDLLARPEEHARLWRRLLLAGALVGLPGGVVAAWLTFGPGGDGQTDVVGTAVGFATAPALAGAYLALAALATRSRALHLVAPAGRMSLTGYLGESVLMAAIFCGWGLGLLGTLDALPAALVAVAVWAVLDLFAHAWLARHRQGPMERLLRAWTQGPTLRRSGDPRPAPARIP
jgi:uncharacterized protein